ncbi:MAG: hypothetical protein V4544_06040 [Pseudomonadota bacterium]
MYKYIKNNFTLILAIACLFSAPVLGAVKRLREFNAIDEEAPLCKASRIEADSTEVPVIVEPQNDSSTLVQTTPSLDQILHATGVKIRKMDVDKYSKWFRNVEKEVEARKEGKSAIKNFEKINDVQFAGIVSLFRKEQEARIRKEQEARNGKIFVNLPDDVLEHVYFFLDTNHKELEFFRTLKNNHPASLLLSNSVKSYYKHRKKLELSDLDLVANPKYFTNFDYFYFKLHSHIVDIKISDCNNVSEFLKKIHLFKKLERLEISGYCDFNNIPDQEIEISLGDKSLDNLRNLENLTSLNLEVRIVDSEEELSNDPDFLYGLPKIKELVIKYFSSRGRLYNKPGSMIIDKISKNKTVKKLHLKHTSMSFSCSYNISSLIKLSANIQLEDLYIPPTLFCADFPSFNKGAGKKLMESIFPDKHFKNVEDFISALFSRLTNLRSLTVADYTDDDWMDSVNCMKEYVTNFLKDNLVIEKLHLPSLYVNRYGLLNIVTCKNLKYFYFPYHHLICGHDVTPSEITSILINGKLEKDIKLTIQTSQHKDDDFDVDLLKTHFPNFEIERECEMPH